MLTSLEAMRKFAGMFIPWSQQLANELMADEIMMELPHDLAKSIDNAAHAVADVGQLLLKYAPNQEA